MKFKYLTLFVLLLVAINVCAENKRPKVGLVLSGGGAKGFAHVGVLKVLEEAGIQVDVVSGTSMGSIIGGLYAIGYNADMIEQIILEQNWIDLFDDSFTRREVGIFEKDELFRYVGGFPIYKKKIGLPTGLMAGQKVSAMLSRLTWSVHHVENFDDFPRPFRCVATDLETGKPVVLKEGYLPEAIRASMAIPSVFTPVKWKDKILIDGGIVRNLPAQEAKEMGADIIIAVDVTNPLYDHEHLESFVDILNQTINFQTVARRDEQLPLCDIYIHPDINNYTIVDFLKADSLIKKGEQKAREFLPQLMALADSMNSFGTREHISAPVNDIEYINIIDYKVMGLYKVSKEFVQSKLHLSIPGNITPEEIDRAVRRLYGSQFFERVSYQLKATDKGTVLIFHVIENRTNMLNFGLNYTNRHDAAVLLNATFRNLLGHGSKLSINNKLGHNREFGTNYIFQTNVEPGFAFGFDIKAKEMDFDQFNDHVRFARYDLYNLTFDLQFKALFSNSSAMGLNFQRQRTILDPSVVAIKDPENSTLDYFNILLFMDIDTFDHTVFPKSGTRLHLESKYFRQFNQNPMFEKSFTRYFLTLKRVRKLSKDWSAFYGLTAGYHNGKTVPVEQLFYFGGNYQYENYMFAFAGLDYMEISAKNLALAKLGLQYEIFSQNYIAFELNTGNWGDRFQDMMKKGDSIWSGCISYGLDTPIGPVKASIASNNREKDIVGTISIGHWF